MSLYSKYIKSSHKSRRIERKQSRNIGQRFGQSLTFTRPIPWLSSLSGTHGQVRASTTSGGASVYFTVQYCTVSVFQAQDVQKQVFSSIQLSRSVMSDSLRPHAPQHTRPPCPSPTPRVHSNPCPLSWWCHPTISYCVIPFSSHLQSFPASGSFPMSQLFAGGGQSIGVSASASVLPMNIQDWFPLGWTGRISLQSKGLSRVFSNTTVQKHQFFSTQLSSQSNSHIHTWPLEKP